MTDAPPPSRRRALGYLAALPLLGTVRPAFAAGARGERPASERLALQAAPPQDGKTLLVAGPEGGTLDQWGQALVPGLARSLGSGAAIRTTSTGGADGVTGANQFEARAAPDGGTALLAPGAAALAWLAGDSRAQFDVARWVAVLTGTGSAVVVGTVGTDALAGARRLRVALGAPAGPEITALLALELMGADAAPAPGLGDPGQLQAAFRRGEAQLALLHGAAVPAQLVALAPLGARPLFSYGAVDQDGGVLRDPRFPDLPQMAELAAELRGAAPSGRLFQAWVAASVAARTAFCLALPQLTPAALVAQWRRAGAQAAVGPELQGTAETAGIRLLAGADAAANVAALAPDPAALLEYRRWLAARLGGRPG